MHLPGPQTHFLPAWRAQFARAFSTYALSGPWAASHCIPPTGFGWFFSRRFGSLVQPTKFFNGSFGVAHPPFSLLTLTPRSPFPGTPRLVSEWWDFRSDLPPPASGLCQSSLLSFLRFLLLATNMPPDLRSCFALTDCEGVWEYRNATLQQMRSIR